MSRTDRWRQTGQGMNENFFLGTMVAMVAVGAVISIGGHLSDVFGSMVPGKAKVSVFSASSLGRAGHTSNPIPKNPNGSSEEPGNTEANTNTSGDTLPPGISKADGHPVTDVSGANGDTHHTRTDPPDSKNPSTKDPNNGTQSAPPPAQPANTSSDATFHAAVLGIRRIHTR